jgi:DNA-binding XRE family transcriptional regulator
MRVYRSPSKPVFDRLPGGLLRRKPRSFLEWTTLRRWRKLPAWEIEPIGYLLRLARERSGQTQQELAAKLDCSQQAIAQAERWQANPTVDLMRRWAEACGTRLRVELPGRPIGVRKRP